MLENYQTLIEAVIEFKYESRRLIAQYHDETYVYDCEPYKVDIAVGYHI